MFFVVKLNIVSAAIYPILCRVTRILFHIIFVMSIYLCIKKGVNMNNLHLEKMMRRIGGER